MLRLLFALAAFVAALAYALVVLRRPPPEPERSEENARTRAAPVVDPQAEPLERVSAHVRSIPPGCVITVGHLADLAGLGNRMMEVGRLVQRLEGREDVPWWRVVRKDGNWGVVPGTAAGDRQQELLQAEGVTFSGGRISLDEHEWRP